MDISGMAQVLTSRMQFGVLKEPRGFMKVLQILFTLLGFAMTTSFGTSFILQATCSNNNVSSVVVPVEYNFKLFELRPELCGTTLDLRQDFSSDAGFFVAVGVIAFLFAIVVLFAYCFYSSLYEENALLPLADCVVHGIFTVLFLASASAWANSLNGLKSATTLSTIVEENSLCGAGKCNITQEPNYSKLNISIILGFLNMFLFGSNIWFLYKETAIFKEKQAQLDQAGNTQSLPPAGV